MNRATFIQRLSELGLKLQNMHVSRTGSIYLSIEMPEIEYKREIRISTHRNKSKRNNSDFFISPKESTYTKVLNTIKFDIKIRQKKSRGLCSLRLLPPAEKAK